MTLAGEEHPFEGGYYWRLDHQGWPLSTSWRSTSQSDPDYQEKGTSAWGSLEELLYNDSHGVAGYARGDVAIVAFSGDRVDWGLDGEPVVIPLEEVGRWNHADWEGLKSFVDEEGFAIGAEDVDADLFHRLGWVPVSTLPVLD